jgi:hypothetical protein
LLTTLLYKRFARHQSIVLLKAMYKNVFYEAEGEGGGEARFRTLCGSASGGLGPPEGLSRA